MSEGTFCTGRGQVISSIDCAFPLHDNAQLISTEASKYQETCSIATVNAYVNNVSMV